MLETPENTTHTLRDASSADDISSALSEIINTIHSYSNRATNATEWHKEASSQLDEFAQFVSAQVHTIVDKEKEKYQEKIRGIILRLQEMFFNKTPIPAYHWRILRNTPGFSKEIIAHIDTVLSTIYDKSKSSKTYETIEFCLFLLGAPDQIDILTCIEEDPKDPEALKKPNDLQQLVSKKMETIKSISSDLSGKNKELLESTIHEFLALTEIINRISVPRSINPNFRSTARRLSQQAVLQLEEIEEILAGSWENIDPKTRSAFLVKHGRYCLNHFFYPEFDPVDFQKNINTTDFCEKKIQQGMSLFLEAIAVENSISVEEATKSIAKARETKDPKYAEFFHREKVSSGNLAILRLGSAHWNRTYHSKDIDVVENERLVAESLAKIVDFYIYTLTWKKIDDPIEYINARKAENSEDWHSEMSAEECVLHFIQNGQIDIGVASDWEKIEENAKGDQNWDRKAAWEAYLETAKIVSIIPGKEVSPEGFGNLQRLQSEMIHRIVSFWEIKRSTMFELAQVLVQHETYPNVYHEAWRVEIILAILRKVALEEENATDTETLSLFDIIEKYIKLYPAYFNIQSGHSHAYILLALFRAKQWSKNPNPHQNPEQTQEIIMEYYVRHTQMCTTNEYIHEEALFFNYMGGHDAVSLTKSNISSSQQIKVLRGIIGLLGESAENTAWSNTPAVNDHREIFTRISEKIAEIFVGICHVEMVFCEQKGGRKCAYCEKRIGDNEGDCVSAMVKAKRRRGHVNHPLIISEKGDYVLLIQYPANAHDQFMRIYEQNREVISQSTRQILSSIINNQSLKTALHEIEQQSVIEQKSRLPNRVAFENATESGASQGNYILVDLVNFDGIMHSSSSVADAMILDFIERVITPFLKASPTWTVYRTRTREFIFESRRHSSTPTRKVAESLQRRIAAYHYLYEGKIEKDGRTEDIKTDLSFDARAAFIELKNTSDGKIFEKLHRALYFSKTKVGQSIEYDNSKHSQEAADNQRLIASQVKSAVDRMNGWRFEAFIQPIRPTTSLILELHSKEELQAIWKDAFDEKWERLNRENEELRHERKGESLTRMIQWSEDGKTKLRTHSPDAFFPHIHEGNYNGSVTFQIFQQFCESLESSVVPTKISLNLSQGDLSEEPSVSLKNEWLDDTFESKKTTLESLQFLMDKYAIDPSKIIFEITEGISIANADTSQLEILAELQSTGCEVWLDDYGQELSNSAKIIEFLNHGIKINGIKIDGKFVGGLAGETEIDEECLAIIESFSVYAQKRKTPTPTVIEYVEGKDIEEGKAQLRAAFDLRITYIQGFIHGGQPVPTKEFFSR